MTGLQTPPGLRTAASTAGWKLCRHHRDESGAISLWEHPSGAKHLHHERSEEREHTFGVVIETPATDDRGAAHVLEHWVGAGSAAYPMSSALLTASQRCGSAFLNGFTETGRTSYTFSATDAEDHRGQLDVLLDAVYHPLLTDRTFAREACRALPSSESATRAHAWTGVVHNEMRLKPERPTQWLSRLFAARHAPGSHHGFRHEGVPSALPELTAADTRAFHRAHYRPGASFSFGTGPGLVDALTALARVTADAPAGRTLPAEPSRSVTALHPPAALARRSWVTATLSWPGRETASWVGALHAHAVLIQAWGRRGNDRLICPPSAVGDDVVLLVATPGDGLDAQAREEAGQSLLREISKATDGASPEGPRPPTLLEHFAEPYGGLPDGIRWGLAVSAARSAGLAPFALLVPGSVEAASVPPRPAAAFLDPAGLIAEPGGPPTTERVESDQALWRLQPPSRDARCLPLRPLGDRPWQPLAPAHAQGPGLDLLDPPDADGTVVARVSLPVDRSDAPLLQPLVKLLSLGAGKTRLLPGIPQVREEGRGVVADLFVAGWTPAGWQRSTSRLRDLLDGQQGAVRASAVVSALLRAGSGRLLLSPQELSESAAFAEVSATGAAHDAMAGLPAMVAWKGMTDSEAVVAGLRRLLDRAERAPVRLLAFGSAALVVAKELAATLPPPATDDATSWDTAQARDRIRVPARGEGYAHALVWPLPPAAAPAVAEVLARDVQRRILHPWVREEGGAYATHAFYDPGRGGLGIWIHADPAGEERLARLRERICERYRPPDRDGLETARLMASRTFTPRPVTGPREVVRRWGPASRGGGGLLSVTADDLEQAVSTWLGPVRPAAATLG
ncbi:insulinase family protein [Streptomyces sp. NBC_01013]|uniref:insulinase family protein n=1 Tax=Streptomyces sp. NBC_01013 TaxID=2903718 RepID=UPI00386B1C35|nr:insulinase family protein [Streptomyces sp. NBC_01013]